MLRGAGPHRRSRAAAWFAGLALVSGLLIAVSGTQPARAIQDAGAAAVEPLRSAIGSVGEAVADVLRAIGEIDALRAENESLRAQLAGAEQRLAELEEAARENSTLRDLLSLTRTLEMDLLPVRILSRDPSNFSWEVGIDAGSDDGVRPGMPVLAAATGHGALAGSVVAVGPDTAVVRLVVDPRSRVVALDQRTRSLGLVAGQLGGQLVMLDVPVSEEVTIGDAIVSAGLVLAPEGGTIGARSPVPRGLLIGRVQALEPDANALTQTLFVRPALDFPILERMLVVLRFEQD